MCRTVPATPGMEIITSDKIDKISFHQEPVEMKESCGVCGEMIVGSGKTEYTRRVRADKI